MMIDTDGEITPNRKRLYELGVYLYNLPEDYENFAMSRYYMIPNPEWNEDSDFTVHRLLEVRCAQSTEIVCGTAACAVGHTPSLFKEEAKQLDSEMKERGVHPLEWWERVSKYILGVPGDQTIWYFLFGGSWALVDNTSKGAAQRIFYFLREGESKVEALVGGMELDEILPVYSSLTPEDVEVTW